MASVSLLEKQGIRIAVEGCGHGVLHEIYASVAKSCELKGWSDVDLLIIGGDFQAVRNASDLKAVSMPAKYYAMHDFHEYYSGTRVAPYLTIFIGGNHEASNYMWELYYGGWAAPRIYYMGAANVIRLGPLRIAGLSGIWKGYNYKKPHFERLPYSNDDVRSIYHVREFDVRKLLQIRTQVDIGLSHDWPRGMEWKGNHRLLFTWKPDFEREAKEGTLGSVAAANVLNHLRPFHWFSAHLHTKYAAVWPHSDVSTGPQRETIEHQVQIAVTNGEEIELELDQPEQATGTTAPPKNDAEIDLDMDDDDVAPEIPAVNKEIAANESDKTDNGISEDIRSLLPEAFAKPSFRRVDVLPFPAEITNKSTRFLALNKCLPKRDFLQLLEITPHSPSAFERPLQLEYDKEWLAITRVFAHDLHVGDPRAQVPPDKGDAHYRPLIEEEITWVEEHLVRPKRMFVPEDFERTAPVYDPAVGLHTDEVPREYSNAHTQAFCDLLQISNPFHASEVERARLMQAGPRQEERGFGRGGGRGSFGRGGRGFGRGRGGSRGRGRGRGR